MSYAGIKSKIQTCSITDENEFDAFADDISVLIADLNLSVNERNDLIELLLLNAEGQPEQEFVSWSLLHFIEWLAKDESADYEGQLLISLKRKPKFFTLLLANRVLNAIPIASTDRTRFLNALKDVASRDSFDGYVRDKAKGFYEYQLNRN